MAEPKKNTNFNPKYNPNYDTPKNPVGFALLSLFLGVVSVFCVVTFEGTQMVVVLGTIGGAAGMVVGGYAMGLSNRSKTVDRIQFMAFSAVGIMASVIAFMFGFTNLLG
jgi:FtsH-binding integral membrane protein